jgi:pimeloyl-ACP methyl ester carboxylesterase
MSQPSGFQTGFADVGEARLYYETAGVGQPLVLLHPLVADSRLWDAQFSAFSQHYHVVRYDMRGFNNSTTAPGPFAYRRDLYELLNFLDIQQAHLLGSSMGGRIAMDFALEHPDMVRSLVLVAAEIGGHQPTGEPPAELLSFFQALQQGEIEQAAGLAVQIWLAGPYRTADEIATPLRRLVREMNIANIHNWAAVANEQPLVPPNIERLHELAAPTLVIVGDQDYDLNLTTADLLANGISGAQKIIMGDTAHLPSLEKPAEFNQTVLDFYKEF